jgi:hypothetical protein
MSNTESRSFGSTSDNTLRAILGLDHIGCIGCMRDCAAETSRVLWEALAMRKRTDRRAPRGRPAVGN